MWGNQLSTTFLFKLRGSGEYFPRAHGVKVHYRRKLYAANRYYRSNFGLKRRREFWSAPKCGEYYWLQLLCLNQVSQINIFYEILRLKFISVQNCIRSTSHCKHIFASLAPYISHVGARQSVVDNPIFTKFHTTIHNNTLSQIKKE